MFGQIGLKRNDKVISLGGGAATDLAGSSPPPGCGIGVIHPDHAAGLWSTPRSANQTGISTDAGKNLVGFLPRTRRRLIDIATLETVRATRSSQGWLSHQDRVHRRPRDPEHHPEADPQAALDPAGDVLPG